MRDPPLSLQYPTSFRSQVVRVNMLPPEVRKEIADFNKSFRCAAQRHRLGKLYAARHAMAERYHKQDRSDRRAGPDSSCEFHAGNLSQGKVLLASSSCMARHGNAVSYQLNRSAKIVDGKGFNLSDFTFILRRRRERHDPARGPSAPTRSHRKRSRTYERSTAAWSHRSH